MYGRLMDLNSILVFNRVVRAGSFSAAARELRMPKSTVSSKVAELERHLGVTLLIRTTRKLSLTDAGQSYFEVSARSIDELVQAEAGAAQTQKEPTGLLRVTATVEMGSTVIAELTAEFLKKFPKVQVELVLTDRVVDLVAEGIDVGIRAGELEDSSLIAKKIGMSVFHVFASASYLKKSSQISHPKDLEKHSCLRFTAVGDGKVWELRKEGRSVRVNVQGGFSANNLDALVTLTSAGHGVALLPSFLCREDSRKGKLVQVLPDWIGDQDPMHLVYPSQRFISPKTKAFTDFISERLKNVF